MLLLYCITDAAFALDPPPSGVRGAAVASVTENGVRCFYSELDSPAPDPAAIRRDALDFHNVTHRIFTATAIIPFRYPTLLPSMAEVGAYLRRHAGQYNHAIRQFQDTVQMEVRIEPAGAPAEATTGAGYLRSRAEAAAKINAAVQAFRVAPGDKVLDWRQRETPLGARCFALVRREQVGDFQQDIQRLRIDPGLSASLSGPWPPTEFLPVFA